MGDKSNNVTATWKKGVKPNISSYFEKFLTWFRRVGISSLAEEPDKLEGTTSIAKASGWSFGPQHHNSTL